jgi:hypothetical protein
MIILYLSIRQGEDVQGSEEGLQADAVQLHGLVVRDAMAFIRRQKASLCQSTVARTIYS